MSELSTNLKRARKALGLSQQDIAERSGLSQRSISQLENGIQKTIPDQYIQFLNNNGIDLGVLYSKDVVSNIIKRTAAQQDSSSHEQTAYMTSDAKEGYYAPPPALSLSAEEYVMYDHLRTEKINDALSKLRTLNNSAESLHYLEVLNQVIQAVTLENDRLKNKIANLYEAKEELLQIIKDKL